uniref:Putative myoneurin n=1 Tax=Culex tarsalis TaxID=7177 RepID=A0A1Q3EYQ9_CULTA
MNPPVQPAMCRVCTCTDRQLIPFAQFDTDRKDYRLAEAIAAVGCVRVENNDGLPQHCCVRCLRAIESAYKIQRQCQETDRLLREMFLVKQDVPLEAVVEVKKEKEEEFEIEQLIFKEEVEEAQLQETVEVSSIKQEIEETETETVNDAARDSDECVKNEATIKEEIEESQLQLNNDEMEIDEYAQLEEQESDGDDDEELVDKAIVKSRICCGCRQYFNSSEELVAHSHEVHYRKRSKPTAKLPFQCNICYQCLPTNSEVGDHMKRFCEDRMTYPCKQCNIGFYDYKSLKIHQGLHGAERKCYMCPYVYNSSTDLRIHMQRHCPFDGMYKCLVCGAVYNSPEILKEHSLSHPTVQPFRCPHCPRVFKTRYYLTKHMDKHVKQGSAV